MVSHLLEAFSQGFQLDGFSFSLRIGEKTQVGQFDFTKLPAYL